MGDFNPPVWVVLYDPSGVGCWTVSTVHTSYEGASVARAQMLDDGWSEEDVVIEEGRLYG